MEGRVALVTGGCGGIGTAICQELAKSGAKVAAGYNAGGSSERAEQWIAKQKELGYDFSAHYGDVANFESAKALVADVESQLGPIDILVNCAGITRDTTLKKMSVDMWRSVLTINLDSVFNVTRNVIEGMLERKYGRIVCISSINGQKGQFGQTNYSSAKSGMYGFVKALAQETAAKGITVNAVSPGYVGTDMVKAVPEDVLTKIIGQIPVGRLAEPNEIGRAVKFLADDSAGFITGTNLAVNGGQHMY